MSRFLIMFGMVLFSSLLCGGHVSSFAAAAGSWDSVLAKARVEATVTISGPGTASVRQALTKPFEDRYGIKVEYDGSRSSTQKT
jgi:ABC-type glycerol-3-phosphate transport system substrate-binding protein